MTFDYEAWQSELAASISEALVEFRPRADDAMEVLALDCHPWNGEIGLSFLTNLESETSPAIADLSEMASWKYFDFTAELIAWKSAMRVGSSMRPLYEGVEEADRKKVVRRFLLHCAQAVASKHVQSALATYTLAANFKITVQHPDTCEEFYPQTGTGF